MPYRRRVSRALLAFLLAFSVVFIANPAYSSAIQMNSYAYLARDLVRPNLIAFDTAKEKGHIKRLYTLENEYTYVFENIDGTITSYTYNTQVQTKDSRGNLHDIDLEIKAKNGISGQVDAYTVTGNGYDIILPRSLDEHQPVIASYQGYTLSIAPIVNSDRQVTSADGRLKKIKDYNGTIAYDNAFGEDTSLEISTTLSGFKEDIILRKAPDSNTFNYAITAPDLTGDIRPDGTAVFYDPVTLAHVYTIPAPFAIDSYKGPRIEGDGHYTEAITVTLQARPDGSWLYSMAVDKDFLYGKDTVYPVVIDPTLLINQCSEHKDTYVAEGTPNTNYYTGEKMYVGKDSSLLKCRGYVNFELSRLWTADALSITGATYNTEEYLGYTSTCYVRVYRVTGAWTSPTLKWSNQPTVDTSTIIDSKLVNSAGNYAFNVTSLVQGWHKNYYGLAGGFAQNGFVLMSDRESSIVLRKFRSSEATSNPPVLVIDYSAVDRTAPNKPTGLSASYARESSFNGTAKLTVSWTAATDLPSPGGTGIKNYEVVVKNASGTTVASNTNVTATSYTTPTFLPGSTTYTFYVKSVDNAVDRGGVPIYNKSADASVTLAVPDCLKPTINSLTVTPSSWTNADSVTLGWSVTEPSGLNKLEYWYTGGSTKTVTTPALTGTTQVSTSDLASNAYTLNVRFTDNHGNIATSTKMVYVDKTAPSTFTLTLADQTETTADLSWTASNDSNGIANYRIYKNGTQIATTTATGYTATGLVIGTSYTFQVRAYDTAGNYTASNSVGAEIVDQTAPSAITDLAVANISGTSADLAWTAATDNTGVSGYKIYVDGILIGNTAEISYTVTGLVHDTDYALTVRAYDEAGNTGNDSNIVTIHTEQIITGRLPLHEPADISILGGAAFADLMTGNLSYTTEDLSLQGWPLNLAISRNYNSLSDFGQGLGYGWAFGLDMRLIEAYSVENPNNPRQVSIRDQNGTVWLFITETDSGVVTGYTAPFGCPYELEMVGGLYRLTDTTGLIYSFNSNRQLAVVHEQPSLIEVKETVDSVDRLKSVTFVSYETWVFNACYDTAGSFAGFVVEDGACPFTLTLSGGQYVLTEIESSSRTYAFAENSPSALDEILAMTTQVAPGTAVKMVRVSFEYDAGHRLSAISDELGNALTLTYDGSTDRVACICAGSLVLVTYHYNIAGQMYQVERIHGNDSLYVYAVTSYGYDANGYLCSIEDPDHVKESLTFSSEGRLLGHASLYSVRTIAADDLDIFGRRLEQIEYGTTGTTVRRFFQFSEMETEATEETITATIELGKTVYTIAAASGFVESIDVYEQPASHGYTGENLIRTITRTCVDEDEDGTVDSIALTIADTDSSTPNLSSDEPVALGEPLFYACVKPDDSEAMTFYDPAGRVIAICEDPANHGSAGHSCRQYSYTPAGRLAAESNRYGQTTSYQYDPSGRVFKTTHADGHESVSCRDFIVQPGFVFTTAYLESIGIPNGDNYFGEPDVTFSNDFFLHVQIDYGLNYFLETHLDTLEQRVYEEIRNCGDWLFLVSAFNGLGQLQTQTNRAGDVTRYTYNANGDVLTETVEQEVGPDLITAYTYTADDRLESETDPFGNVTTCYYEPVGEDSKRRLLTRSTLANGVLTVEAYDYTTLENNHYYTRSTTHYRGETTASAVNSVTTALLDESDQVTAISRPVSDLYNSQTEIYGSYAYNEDYQLAEIGHNGFSYVFAYGEDGDVTGISVSDGINSIVLLSRSTIENSDGSRTDADTYANGQTVTTATDVNGRTDTIQLTTGGNTVDVYDFSYGGSGGNPAGDNLTTVIDHASGRRTVSSRSDDADSFNQTVTVHDLASQNELYTLQITNSEQAVTLQTQTGGTGQNYVYSKDAQYRLYRTGYELPGQLEIAKTSSYGGYGQLTGSVLNVGGTNILQNSLSYRSIASVAFSEQVESETIQYGSASTAYGHEYDAVGNITRITRTQGGTTTDLYRYKYDEAGQLVREDNTVTNQTTVWVYDEGGNIRSRKIYTLTTAGMPDEQTLIDTIEYAYSTGIWKDLLTSYDGQNISYDASGNPTGYLGATMTWTMGRQLANYNKDSLAVGYTYNENGIRTSKTVNGVRTDYYLSGSQVIAEMTNGNRIDYRYDGNGQLIALRWNGSDYYAVTNIQGDVIGLIDGSGTSVVQYTYDAWGNQTSCTGTLANTLGQANPYRYRGYRFDNETGLYYLQSRYYDAAVGRFVNADDFMCLGLSAAILSCNLFAYCENNSIIGVDPTGYYSYLLNIKLTNLQGTYYGKQKCLQGILNLILVSALVTYSVWSFGYNLLKIAVAGTIASIALSSAITIPLGIIGFLSCVGAISYGTYMTSVILCAIDFTNRYQKYTLKKAWKHSHFTYTISL